MLPPLFLKEYFKVPSGVAYPGIFLYLISYNLLKSSALSFV